MTFLTKITSKKRTDSDKKIEGALDSLLSHLESIKGDFDLDKIFEIIGQELLKVKIASIVSIIDDKKQNAIIRHLSFVGKKKDALGAKKIPLKKFKKYSTALKENKTIFYKNRIEKYQKNLPEISSFFKDIEETNSIITPLVLRGESIGVLELFSSNLKKTHIDIVKDFSQKLMIRVANTILFSEVKESAKRYKDIFENAQEGFLIFNSQQKKIVEVNKAFCQMTGYTRDEVLQMHYLKLSAPEEKDKIEERINFGLRNGFEKEEGALDHEYKIKTKQGKYKFVKININQTINKEEWFIIIEDITKKRQAEVALRREKIRAQKYFNIAGTILIAIDANQKVGLINKKGCEVLECSHDEIIGKDWFDVFLPKKNRDEARLVFNKLMAGAVRPVEYYENSVITKTGKEKIIAWYNTIRKDDEGNIVGILSSGEDITERKQAEQALKESEEKYRKLVDNADDTVAIIDARGYFSFVNESFYRLTGHNKKDLPRLHFSQLIHPDDHSRVVKNFNDRLAGKKVDSTCEFKIITKTSQEKHISYSGTSIKEEGKIIGVQAIIRNITKTKELQENIEQAKEHYEQVIDTIQDGICVIGKDFKIKSCNKAFAKRTNMPIAQIKNKRCQDIIPHYENNLFKNHCQRRSNKDRCIPTSAFFIGTNISTTEKNIDDEGNVHYHRLRAFPSKNEVDEVEQVVLVIKDITEYQKAEEEIRRLSEFNKRILDNVPVSIITINKEGVVVSANSFFYELAVAEKSDFIGKNIFTNRFFKREGLTEKYKKLLKTGKSFSKSNCKTINSQGEIKYLNIIATPVRNKKGEIEGAISMALDNTEAILKEQEIAKLNINLEKKVSKRTQQLNDINKELQKILELKSKFISDASHELRTPLTIMQGNLDLIIRETKNKKKEVPETFHLINKEIGQISGILSDLTMLTNTDSGAEKIKYEKINLASLIKAVEESLKILAKQKKIKVLNNKTKKTINVMGDEARLEKLLINILRNAIKYTGEGGVVKIQAEENDKTVKIMVEDNGIGIPKEDLPYIFERFYRADKARSNAEGGTGLGLSIAKWIAESHYGKIDVESTLGKGSKFIISLPCDFKKQKEEMSLF